MCPYCIKPMETEEEIIGKAGVHCQCWHETYAELLSGEYMKKITPEKCINIARNRPQNTIVAKDGNKVIGFAAYGPYRDDTLEGCGEVYAIYVLAAYQGKKVGYALMNAALARLAGYKKVALWVLQGNSKAIGFYEKYGFYFDGTEKEILLGTPKMELRMICGRGIAPAAEQGN